MRRLMVEILDYLYFLLIYMALKAVNQSVIGNLCGVRNKRNHCMLDIIIHGFQYVWRELLAQLLAFPVDISI